MDKEEILKYARIFSTAKGDTHKIHFVNENKTINEPDLWKEVLNLINKLQKENGKLKKELETFNGLKNGTTIMFGAKTQYWRKDKIEKYFISKDIIRNIIVNHYPDYAIMKIYELLGE